MTGISIIGGIHFHVGPFNIDLGNKRSRKNFSIFLFLSGIVLAILASSPLRQYLPQILKDILNTVGGIFLVVGVLLYRLTNGETARIPKSSKPQKVPKTTNCPQCHNQVVPYKLGKVYLCPLCQHEFKSTEQRLKEIHKGIKILKELDQ